MPQDTATEATRLEQMKSVMKERVTQYSPDLQILEIKKALLTEMSDALSDLPEEAITATALIRTIDEHIIPVPATRAFAEHFASLMRSRDRLGRIEAATISNRNPSYQSAGAPLYQHEEEELRQQEAAASNSKKGGFWSRVFGRK